MSYGSIMYNEIMYESEGFYALADAVRGTERCIAVYAAVLLDRTHVSSSVFRIGPVIKSQTTTIRFVVNSLQYVDGKVLSYAYDIEEDSPYLILQDSQGNLDTKDAIAKTESGFNNICDVTFAADELDLGRYDAQLVTIGGTVLTRFSFDVIEL